ncbi:MAG: phytanoyl-CoA dioxygenase family protein [Chloroflexi bacterium]|nr:phytanoyl-CoA dioxygenase family protein [Chloroflexota bacterium]
MEMEKENVSASDHPGARRQLLTSGYCLFPQVLDQGLLEELRRVTDALLDEQSQADRERYRYQGSNISVAYQDAVFARLFTWPKALQALADLGFARPKWMSAFLLSKPPHAPPLYWHQDWWAWDDPASASPVPSQVFLMYYLTDTQRENGCLRLIPGTHWQRNPLHDLLPAAHTNETYEANPDSVIFSIRPDEVDVPVKAGDLIIGDARILHAAHANQTDHHRSLLTLWYLPDYDSLSDAIKARLMLIRPAQPPGWSETPAGKLLEPLIPSYQGSAEPIAWNRVPGRYLVPAGASPEIVTG